MVGEGEGDLVKEFGGEGEAGERVECSLIGSGWERIERKISTEKGSRESGVGGERWGGCAALSTGSVV